MAEAPDWWADAEALPEWCEEALTPAQLTLPNVVKWMIFIRSHDDLTATQKHVGLVLATYMHPTTLKAYPSVATLARDCSRRRDTVRVSTRRLRDLGWLTITGYRTTRGDARSVNHYAGRFPEGVYVVRPGRKTVAIYQEMPF